MPLCFMVREAGTKMLACGRNIGFADVHAVRLNFCYLWASTLSADPAKIFE